MLQSYTCMQYTVIHKIYKMTLSTVKWAQWDKTQSRELLGLFICVCTTLCAIVVHNTAQNRPDNFPSYPLDHCSGDVNLREEGDRWRKVNLKIGYVGLPSVVNINARYANWLQKRQLCQNSYKYFYDYERSFFLTVKVVSCDAYL